MRSPRFASAGIVLFIVSIFITLARPSAGAVPSAPPSPQGAPRADVDRDFRLGTGLYRQGFPDRAIAPLERVRAGDPSRRQLAEALFLLGEAYRIAESYSKAEERYGELLEQFPRAERRRSALVGRGESLVRTGRAEEAVSLLEEATRSGGSAGEGDAQDEERAVALYWLGEAHSRAGDRSEAIPPYRSLVREYPAHALTPYGAYNLAGILREMRRPTDGLALLDGLEDTRLPADLRDPVRLLKGDLALATGDEGRAARDYGRVESPDLRPRALAGIAYAARAAGDRRLLDEARRELQERFGRTSHAADIDLLLGAWEAEEGKVEEADRALSAHLQGPRGREARFHRAWARVVAERHGEAAALLGELATGDDDWALRAGARLEGELRLAAEWQAALNAALEFLRRHSDAEPAAQVFAGAVESAFRLRRDDDVLRLEALFKEHFAGHDLAREVTHFAAEAALRGGDLDGAITRLRSLHRDSAGEARAELAPRLAWALYQRDPESSGDEIEALLPGLGGSAAAEVGILLGRARRAEGSASEAHAAFRAARTAGGEGDAGARAALEEAVLLLEDGEDELAAAAYTGILQGSPPPEVEASALIDLAELRARTGKCGAAIPLFERLLEHPVAERHETATRIGLAFCLWSGGDAGRALEVLEELDRDGLEPALAAEAIYLEGRARASLEEREPAVALLERYRREFPGEPRLAEALRELARLYEALGREELARARLAAAVDAHGESTGAGEALYRLAWLQWEAGEKDACLEGFERLLREHPQSSFAGDAHYRLGDLAYERGDFDEARSHLRAALDSADGDRLGEWALYRIGWSHRKEEGWESARDAFSELGERFPRGELAGEALFLAAEAARRADDPRGERRLLERFLKEHPRHELTAEGSIRLGEILGDAGEWGRARVLLDPLTPKEIPLPLKARQRVTLGRALIHLNAAASSIPLLEEALAEGEALAAEAQFEIGNAYRALGQRKRAVDAYINGTVLYPYRPWAVRSYLEAGRELLGEGKKDEAARLLRRAVEEDPRGRWGREARGLLDSAGVKPAGGKEPLR